MMNKLLTFERFIAFEVAAAPVTGSDGGQRSRRGGTDSVKTTVRLQHEHI